jgi:hypothetical protein
VGCRLNEPTPTTRIYFLEKNPLVLAGFILENLRSSLKMEGKDVQMSDFRKDVRQPALYKIY